MSQPVCAHIVVSYQTKEVPYEGPVIPGNDIFAPLKPGMLIVRGWWECKDCHKKFELKPII